MFRGSIRGAAIYPREVAKSAMRHNAAACILCHNHPSGNTDPSQSDNAITSRLKEALELVDVRVLDHIIVADQDAVPVCSPLHNRLMPSLTPMFKFVAYHQTLDEREPFSFINIIALRQRKS